MEAVNAYVNALDNIESSDKLLQDLGNRHSSYGDGNIKKDYFSVKFFLFEIFLKFSNLFFVCEIDCNQCNLGDY